MNEKYIEYLYTILVNLKNEQVADILSDPLPMEEADRLRELWKQRIEQRDKEITRMKDIIHTYLLS